MTRKGNSVWFTNNMLEALVIKSQETGLSNHDWLCFVLGVKEEAPKPKPQKFGLRKMKVGEFKVFPFKDYPSVKTLVCRYNNMGMKFVIEQKPEGPHVTRLA